MAGTIIADKIQTENSFLTLNVGQTLVATINASGILSNTGTIMVRANGTFSNTALTGVITASQLATSLNLATNNVQVASIQSATGTPAITFAANGAISVGTQSVSDNLSFNSGYGSSAVAYGCRVWVNFNGTGTPAIRGSGNVSSITDGGTGIFTVNFTTSMPDTNYAAMSGFQTPAWPAVTHQYTYAVGSVKVECGAGAGPTYYDPSIFTVAVFR